MPKDILLVVLLAVLAFAAVVVYVWIIFPGKRPFRWYRNNLRWYRKSKKHLLYMVDGGIDIPMWVVHGFNYWTGRIRMRKVRSSGGSTMFWEFHANQIYEASERNNKAMKSTKAE